MIMWANQPVNPDNPDFWQDLENNQESGLVLVVDNTTIMKQVIKQAFNQHGSTIPAGLFAQILLDRFNHIPLAYFQETNLRVDELSKEYLMLPMAKGEVGSLTYKA